MLDCRWMVFAGVLGTLGCKPKPAAEAEAAPVSVTVTRVVTRDVGETLTVSGALSAPPGKDVKLGALAAGRIAEVNVSEGDPVKKGQLLAKLDPGPLSDAVHQAEAALTEAEAVARNDATKLTRAKKLFELGVSARQEADDAEASSEGSAARVSTARAALSTARTQLGRSELRAPFDGVVVRVLASAGEPVDANKEVVEVAALSFLELRAGVPAKDAGRVRQGLKATVGVEGVPEKIPAEIYAVAPGVDPATGTVMLRMRLANPGSLRLGQIAKAIIQVEDHLGVAAIPVSAPVSIADAEPGKVVVALVGEDGKIHRTPIETGASDGQWLEVRSGVSPGQTIVASGAYALPDDTVVAFQKVEDAGTTQGER